MTYTGTMTCTSCGGTALAEVFFPDHPAVVATVCLTCGAVLPVTEDAEQS